MGKRNIKAIFLIIPLLLSSSVEAQVAEQKGELRLYHRATQIGTVANREFKDDKGRVFKVIYYTGGGELEPPYLEELLREQLIEVYTYDDHDCPIRNETYELGMKLTRTANVRCLDGTATPRLTTIRDARGVEQRETRHTASGGTRTVLYFDSDGKKVIAITGDTPPDIDLLHGWGKKVSGFASGIAANRTKGLQQDMSVSVTIKNISDRSEAGLMVSPVKAELRNSDGRLVEPKARYKNHQNDPRSEECRGGFGVPFVGKSQWLPGYDLGEQYDRLAPGRYSFTVTHCLSGKRGLLISNTIYLDLEHYK